MFSENMQDDIEKVLLSEEEIQEIVTRVGAEVSRDYRGKNLVLVSVLKGSVVFMADLMRAIDIPLSIDLWWSPVTETGRRSSGKVKIIKDLDLDLSGQDLLLVEDILDTGRTLYNLREILKMRSPSSIKICTFLDKPERRQADIAADYVGARVPDEFVVGYGLDYSQRYRNLPYLGVLKPRVYE